MPFSHLSSLQPLRSALTHPLSHIPFSQTARHLLLPAPPPQGHQWSLQARLSRCPKRWMSLLQEVWSRLSCLASDSPRRE